MKPYYMLFIALLISGLSFARPVFNTDTAKKARFENTYTSIESVPEYPGGITAFVNYISQNVKYPDIARLIGINGKVVVSFIIDTTGKVTEVIPQNCIGAGCEAEAVNVLQNSTRWKPGIQNSRPVRVQYSIPISFSMEKGTVFINQLKPSGYGFVFEIRGKRYTIDEAEQLLGKSFPSDQVEIAEPYYDSGHEMKFQMPEKNGVYLLKMKF